MKLLAFLTALPGVFSWLQLTGLKGGSLSIPCIYDMKYRNHVKYWCRGPSWIFCSILKKSITQQRDTDSLLISDNKSQHVFTVTMRGLKMDDEDWYWCAIEIQNAGDDGYALKLTITDGSFGFFMQNNRLTGLAERQLDVPCEYDPALQSYEKMWCKGVEVRSCKVLRGESTDTSSRVSTTDNRTHRVFTVTLRRLSPEDEGWYWCTTEKKEYKIPLHLTVREGLRTTVIPPPASLPDIPHRHHICVVMFCALSLLILGLFIAWKFLWKQNGGGDTLSTEADGIQLQDNASHFTDDLYVTMKCKWNEHSEEKNKQGESEEEDVYTSMSNPKNSQQKEIYTKSSRNATCSYATVTLKKKTPLSSKNLHGESEEEDIYTSMSNPKNSQQQEINMSSDPVMAIYGKVKNKGKCPPLLQD